MKIIHLSDIHIHSEPILEHNPIERLSLALDHIKNNHVDADMLIITGDISHQGDVASYKKFDEIFTKASLPNHLSPKLLIGNHDDREIFKNYFSTTPTDKNGFVQYDIKKKKKKKKKKYQQEVARIINKNKGLYFNNELFVISKI